MNLLKCKKENEKVFHFRNISQIMSEICGISRIQTFNVQIEEEIFAETISATPNIRYDSHCVQGVRIWSYSGQFFPAFELNTKRHGVSLRIQSECGKMWTRVTPNTDAFHAVIRMQKIAELSSFV